MVRLLSEGARSAFFYLTFGR